MVGDTKMESYTCQNQNQKQKQNNCARPTAAFALVILLKRKRERHTKHSMLKIPVNSTNAETSLLRKFYVLNLLESIGYKLL